MECGETALDASRLQSTLTGAELLNSLKGKFPMTISKMKAANND
jgi:hypothetical protein